MPSSIYKEVPHGFYVGFVVSESADFKPELIASASAIDLLDGEPAVATLASELESLLPPTHEIVASTNVLPSTKAAKLSDGTTMILLGPTDDLMENQLPFMWNFAQENTLRLFVIGVGEPLFPGITNSYKGTNPPMMLGDHPEDVVQYLVTGNANYLTPERRPCLPRTLPAEIEIDYEEVVE